MNTFAIRTSLANTVGYCVAVGIPTILDSRLHSHVDYGARTYPAGNWIFLPGIAVFVLTYLVCAKNWSCIHTPFLKTLAVVSVLVFMASFTLYNFLPEFPHAHVVFVSIWFGIIIGLGVYITTHTIDLGFMRRDDIEPQLKTERLKMEYDFWWKIFTATSTSYGVSLVYIWIYLTEFATIIIPDNAERNDFLIAITVAAICNFLAFVLVFVWETFRKLGEIKHSLSQPMALPGSCQDKSETMGVGMKP